MKQTINKRASIATKCLEHAWAMLREIEPSIPTAVFIILSARRRKKILGHFAHSAWRNQHGRRNHEIGISSDLFCDPSELLVVMLHEAAHSVLRKDNGGCSPDGRGYCYYHRKEFRDTCFALGLDCEFHNNRYGWVITHWPRDTGVHPKYKRLIQYLSRYLPLGTDKERRRKLAEIRGKKTPQSGLAKMTCSCKDGRSIYVNKTILKKGGILCELCGLPFQPLGS